MKRIFKKWNVVRFIWLSIGLATGIAALIDHNYFLLIPSAYFIMGAVLNVGCFAQSCAINFKKEQRAAPSDSPYENIQFKNHES